MTEFPRLCPHCGERTSATWCPADGVATFELRTCDPESAKLAAGVMVAGKYRVTRLLGRGGFGAVYEADHAGGLGKVALKLLIIADQAEDDIRRFYREAQVTAQLRHANTVRVFDVGQAENGALFIAMELLRGQSLEDHLMALHREGKVLSHGEAIDMACDVLKSLAEAHAAGLVHRDLKPATVMFSEVAGETLVKVLDFGVAHVQDSSLTGTGRALGTPAYMSPEQCTSAPLDARSDLYALGVILFRCVAGKAPFSDPNPLTVMFAHAAQPPPDLYAAPRTEISDAFAEVVMRALAKRPEDRFASAREMRSALEAARGAPLSAMPSLSAETGDYAVRKLPTPHVVGTQSQRVVATTPGNTAQGVPRNLSPRYVVTASQELVVGDQSMSDQTFDAAVPAMPMPTQVAAPLTPGISQAQPAPGRNYWLLLLIAGAATVAVVAWLSRNIPPSTPSSPCGPR